MSSSTANSSTLLPPAVRVFKIVGTTSASVLAGLYLASSLHTVPTLLSMQQNSTTQSPPPSNSSPEAYSQQPATLAVKIFHRLYKNSHSFYRNLIITSAGSFSYVAWWLYNYLPGLEEKESIVEGQASFSSSSFLPRTGGTGTGTTTTSHEAVYGGVNVIGGAWLYFVAGGLVVFGIVPYTKLLMKPISHRLMSAGEALEVEEKSKVGLSVVDEAGTWRDLEAWRRWNWGRAGLAGVAAVLGSVGTTCVY